MQYQLASDLLEFERLHVLKLGIWAALSVLAGTALLGLLKVRRTESALVQHFAIQTLAWGLLDAVIVLWAAHGLHLRDLAGATALDRFLWLNVGLDVGYVMVGITLGILGWRLGRRLGLVGAGMGVIVQGLALLVLDLQLSAVLVR